MNRWRLAGVAALLLLLIGPAWSLWQLLAWIAQ